MKEQKLGSYRAIPFQGKLMILLDNEWQRYFDCDIPVFTSHIDKEKRLTLRGPRVTNSPHSVDPTAVQEDAVDG